MKMRLILLLALAVPLPLLSAPKKAAKAIKKAPVLEWPRFARPSEDKEQGRIWALQELLNAHGARLKPDGVFGKVTEAAVKKFQIAHHIKADGVIGPQTMEKLIVRLKRGDKMPAVKALQSAIDSNYGEWKEEVLGKGVGTFGFETEKAVREIQEQNHLKVDGIAGPQTWCIILGGKVKQ